MKSDDDGFTSVKPPVTNADLREVEKSLGFSFPVGVRQHYLSYNGGCPQRNIFRTGEHTYVVSEFLTIKHGRKNLLFEDVYRDLKLERRVFPPHLVAFAIDPGGDYFCFSTRREDEGSIWMYIGEYFDDPARAVRYLAPSLSEFLRGMTTDE